MEEQLLAIDRRHVPRVSPSDAREVAGRTSSEVTEHPGGVGIPSRGSIRCKYYEAASRDMPLPAELSQPEDHRTLRDAALAIAA
jgi:hypothetical protein